MKRKFSKFLALLAVTACVGVAVSSCKDTNEDLQNQIDQLRLVVIGDESDLSQSLQTQINNLKAQLALYQQQLEAINSCECDMDAVEAKLTALQTALAQKANLTDLEGLATVQQLQNEINALRTFIASTYVAKSEYTQAIQTLEAAIEAAKCKCTGECGCDLSSILSRLSAVETAAADAKALAQDAAARADAAKAAADAAKAAADAAKAAADQAAADAAAAKTTAEAAKAAAETAQATADAAKTTADAAKALADLNKEAIDNIKLQLVSMSDSLKVAYENAATAKTQAAANKQLIDELTSRMSTAEQNITNLKNLVNQLTGDVTQLQTDLTTLTNSFNQAVQNMTQELARIEALANANLEKAKAYTDEQIAILKTAVATNTQDIADLKEKVDSLCNVTTDIQNDMKEADDKLNARIDSLAAITKGLEEVDAATQEKIDSIFKEIVKIENRVEAIENSYVTKETFTATIDSVCTLIKANTTRINEVEEAYKAADELMKADIEQLKSDVSGLQDRMADAEEAIAALQGLKDRVENLEKNLANMITGITIQGTHNPAFGTLSLPFNVNSKVLMAYYGEANDDIYFPTSRTGRYVRPAQALTAQEMELLGLSDEVLYHAGDILLDDSEGNAGTLYVTINPNTVDFTGQVLTLENSQAEASKITLGALKQSDKTLTFGWTRAAGNGFYEAPATLAAADVNAVQKVSYDAANIKKIVKEIKNKRLDADFKGMATDIYEVLTSFSLDADAVKATWTDTEGTEHGVYSDYGLAATAVKPFSFNTLYDVDGLIDNMPGYDRVNAVLNRLAKKLHNTVKAVVNEIEGSILYKDVQALKIEHITFNGLTDEQKAKFTFTLDDDITIDGLTYQLDIDENVDVPIHITQGIPVDVSTVTATVPSFNVVLDATASVTNQSTGTAYLTVPVKNGLGTEIGSASINLGDIVVKVDDTVATGDQTAYLNGTAIANLNYNDTVTVNVKMSKLIDLSGKKIHINKTIALDDIADEFGDILGDQVGDINKMLDDIDNVIGDVNTQLDLIRTDYAVRADNAIDRYIATAKDYLESINDRFMKVFGNINNVFQPAMLAGNDAVSLLSQAKSYPTTIKGTTTHLVPTTWNLELLVPVCKKHVAVTDVIKGSDSAKGGNADCKAKLQAANGSNEMNELINGTERNIVLENLAAGYTYEIAYSALDFHGNIATEKYYITVTE